MKNPVVVWITKRNQLVAFAIFLGAIFIKNRHRKVTQVAEGRFQLEMLMIQIRDERWVDSVFSPVQER
jgi:hypothetical protein